MSSSLLTGLGKEYPKMHYVGISRRTQLITARGILTEYVWEFQLRLKAELDPLNI